MRNNLYCITGFGWSASGFICLQCQRHKNQHRNYCILNAINCNSDQTGPVTGNNTIKLNNKKHTLNAVLTQRAFHSYRCGNGKPMQRVTTQRSVTQIKVLNRLKGTLECIECVLTRALKKMQVS